MSYSWWWKEGIFFCELFELMSVGAKWDFFFWSGLYKNFYLLPLTAIVVRALKTWLVTHCFQNEWKCHKPIIEAYKWQSETRPYLHSRSVMRWGLPFWNPVVILFNYLLSVFHKRSHGAWQVLVSCLWSRLQPVFRNSRTTTWGWVNWAFSWVSEHCSHQTLRLRSSSSSWYKCMLNFSQTRNVDPWSWACAKASLACSGSGCHRGALGQWGVAGMVSKYSQHTDDVSAGFDLFQIYIHQGSALFCFKPNPVSVRVSNITSLPDICERLHKEKVVVSRLSKSLQDVVI